MPGWIKISIDETCHVAWLVRAHGREMCLHALGNGPAGNRVIIVLPQIAAAAAPEGYLETFPKGA